MDQGSKSWGWTTHGLGFRVLITIISSAIIIAIVIFNFITIVSCRGW